MGKEEWIKYSFDSLLNFFSKLSDNKIDLVDFLKRPQNYITYLSNWLKQQNLSTASKDDKLLLEPGIGFFIAEVLIVRYQSYWEICQDNTSPSFGRFILTGFTINPNTKISSINNHTIIMGGGSGETRSNKMFDPILSGSIFLSQSALDLEAHINEIEAELINC